jgi:hypothetical protein
MYLCCDIIVEVIVLEMWSASSLCSGGPGFKSLPDVARLIRVSQFFKMPLLQMLDQYIALGCERFLTSTLK